MFVFLFCEATTCYIDQGSTPSLASPPNAFHFCSFCVPRHIHVPLHHTTYLPMKCLSFAFLVRESTTRQIP